MNFLKLCTNNTFCVADLDGVRSVFRQAEGVAMGKSYSCALADIWMGEWEKSIYSVARSTGAKLKWVVRYVDDFCGFWLGSKEQFSNFVEKLNNIHPNIKLTHELEKNGELPFLDLVIIRRNDGFQTSVYRKGCFTGLTTPFSAFTEPRYKRSAINSATLRALNYCSTPQLLSKEFEFIVDLFLENGYPLSFIKSAMKKTKQRFENKDKSVQNVVRTQDRPIRVAMEYSGPMFHQIQRLGKSLLNIDFVSRSSCTLRNLIHSKVKANPVPGTCDNCIYRINCSCKSVYIGETSREVKTRIHEHKSAWMGNWTSSKSAFTNHQNHQPDFDGTSVVCTEKHRRVRLLKEAITIRHESQVHRVIISPNDEEINRNSGALIPNCWLPSFSKLEK